MYQQYPPPAPPQYYGAQYSGCMKFLLYCLSLWIPIAGIIIGIMYQSRPDNESKRLGQVCLILGIISMVVNCCLAILIGVSYPSILIYLESEGYL